MPAVAYLFHNIYYLFLWFKEPTSTPSLTNVLGWATGLSYGPIFSINVIVYLLVEPLFRVTSPFSLLFVLFLVHWFHCFEYVLRVKSTIAFSSSRLSSKAANLLLTCKHLLYLVVPPCVFFSKFLKFSCTILRKIIYSSFPLVFSIGFYDATLLVSTLSFVIK